MKAIDGGAGDRLLPSVERQDLSALTLGISIHNVSFGPECFELTGSNESRGCLQLGILGRTQGVGDSFSQADQRDSQNQDGTHDFHQRESCVPVHAAYLRSSSTSRTRAVAGLMRKARRKPSRS